MSAAGFGPATPGFGVRKLPPQTVASVSKSLQVPTLTEEGISNSSQQKAPTSRSFGALVVQALPAGTETAGTAVKGLFLTVREVAARLRVSTATVYRLVEEGQIAHLRISNAIRIAELDLLAFLERRKGMVP